MLTRRWMRADGGRVGRRREASRTCGDEAVLARKVVEELCTCCWCRAASSRRERTGGDAADLVAISWSLLFLLLLTALTSYTTQPPCLLLCVSRTRSPSSPAVPGPSPVPSRPPSLLPPLISPAPSLVHSGIGLESVLLFACEGAHVVAADINEEAAQRAVKLVADMYPDAPRAIAVKCDVSKEADIKACVAKAVDEFGRLDVMLCVLPPL